MTGSYKTLRTLKDEARIKLEAEGEEVVTQRRDAPHDRRETDGALIHAEDLWRTYVMGAEEIHALRGVSFDHPRRASTWRSWAPRARASRRS